MMRNLLLIGSSEFQEAGGVKKGVSLVSNQLRFTRDPRVGKRVTITGGDWKLSKGTVIEANEQGYRVELASRNKIVTVAKSFVEEVDDFREPIKRELKAELKSAEEEEAKHPAGTPAYGMMNTPNSPGWGGGMTPGAFSEIDPAY